MEFIEKIKPAVPKRVLFFVAALVWGFVSYRILLMGITDILGNTKSYWINFLIGICGYIPFFWFVFLKMYFKHTRRIINSKLEKHCIFSFFDIKGFAIMAFMIIFGITLGKLNIIPELYMGTFFISLGLSLLSAAICFLYSGVRFERVKVKFLVDDHDRTLDVN
jgi:hypothetical protein